MFRFARIIAFTLIAFGIIAFVQVNRERVASAQGSTIAALFAEPSLSPDRKEIAFISGGDIWAAPTEGGEARMLVSHTATESRPIYSPDGKRLAFISTRTGGGDIYVLTFESGDLKRMTFDDGNDQLDGWSRDGRWIYFSSAGRDIAGMNDVYRVGADGGTPMLVTADRYTTEYFSAPSPDGQSLAFVGHGFGAGQWWRNGHSHIDESEIWLMRDGATRTYEQISEGGARELWPMWAADGKSIYYVSDRSGSANIFSRPIGKPAKQVTQFKDGRVLWPSISVDGKSIVFERNYQIWMLDTATGRTNTVSITRRGLPAGPAVDHLRLTDGFQDLALSPDGKKVAFIARGEVFAASVADGGDAVRVTWSIAAESQIEWAPESRRIAYVSERDGGQHVFTYDFSTNTETQVTKETAMDDTPVFSPDGKSLLFGREGREIRVYDFDSKQERLVTKANLERPPLGNDRGYVWSNDSKWIAFIGVGERLFRQVFVVPVAGGEAKPITFLANGGSNTVSWSPDGTFILFDTTQRTEVGQVARVDVIPRTPRFREDQFRDLFKETPQPPKKDEPQSPKPDPSPAASPAKPDAKAPAKKPVEVVFDQIRRRLSLLPVGVDVGYQTISPDGKWLVMIASAEGQQNIYAYSLDELSREPAVTRQITSTAGFKSNAQFTPDSKEVFYSEGGRINIVNLDTRVVRSLSITAELDVDFSKEKMEVFRKAWSVLRDNFYDSNFHGKDWNAVYTQYEPIIGAARTPDEMRRAMNLMVGELNSSHSGVGVGGAGSGPVVGRLGLRFDRSEFESNGRFKITEVIPLSPAAIAKDVKVGDYVLAVEGASLTSKTNFDEVLSYRTNRRTTIQVSADNDGSNKREVVLRPISVGAEKSLVYRNWVEENRTAVAKLSNGRLGYVHMPDMGQGSLNQLYIDLDVENHGRDGVVVDVRNNNGGFVNVYAIDVIARRSYFTMQPRGFTSGPARSVLGQRSLELPTILLTNRHTLSDGEDFTEGYRFLKLGKVVGEPTAGWIIYTSGVSLIDGSTVRLPFIRITAMDGTNMELNPRPVDIPVANPIGESYLNKDRQLERAVAELMKQIGTRGD